MAKINNNSILYFIRKYNDIDHVTPILYSICGKNNLLYLCSLNTHQNFENDYRIFLLKKKFKEVHFIKYEKFFKLSLLQKFNFKLINPFKYNSLEYYFYFCLSFLFKGNRDFGKVNFSKKTNIKFDLVLFDHFNPEAISLFSNLLRKLKNKKNKIFCLPHGFSMYENPGAFNLLTYDFKIIEKYADKIFVTSSNWYKLIKKVIKKKNKIILIGSLRFTSYWRNIIEKSIIVKKKKDIDILIFGNENARFLNLKNYQNMFDYLNEFQNLNIVYKPSTRTNRIKFVKIPPNIKISKSHSLNLIYQSKLVIAHNTSVIFDVLFKNKLFISPRFLRPKNSKFEFIHEKIKCCYIAYTTEEFKYFINNRKFLNKLFLNNKKKLFKEYIFDKKKIINQFIRNI